MVPLITVEEAVDDEEEKRRTRSATVDNEAVSSIKEGSSFAGKRPKDEYSLVLASLRGNGDSMMILLVDGIDEMATTSLPR